MSMQWIISGVLVLSCIFSSNVSAAGVPEKITCSGKVVDDANRPVSGAKVTLYQFKPDVGEQELNTPITEEQITKEDGGFSFSAKTLADRQYRFALLIANKEGLAIGWDNWEMWEDKVTTLAMGRPYTLSGVVVDEAGKPVGGAEVRISMLLIGDPQSGPEKAKFLTGIEPLDFLKTVTDAEGVFAFNGIPAEAKAEFIVKKAGRATINTWNPKPPAGYNPGQYTVQSKDIRIVQPVEARIEGKVVEKDTGKPVGGVRLRCMGENPGGQFGVKPVVSKDDGTFSFEGLEAKTYTIRDVPSSDKPAQWVIKPATVTTTAGQTSSGIILEASKGGMLEVTIIDNEKKPVAGAGVYARTKDNDMQGASGVSNSEGIAAIRLAPGEYETQGAYKEGYSSTTRHQTITIEDGKTTQLEIELRGTPKITGVVRDPNGRAVAGATVRIWAAPGPKAINSDNNGRFEISWNPEQWGGSQKPQPVLVARHAGQNLVAVVDIDEDTKTLDVSMTPGVVFTGKVIDPNGKPIASAKMSVTLWISNYGTSFDNESVMTGQDGRYEYKAIAEGQKYGVSAQADGYGLSHVKVDADDAVNNRLEIKPLTLKTADMSISGIVVDANDKPVAKARIFVIEDGQQSPDTKTDAQGRFVFDKLCAGQVYIYASVKDDQSDMYRRAIVSAGDMDVTVVVAPPNAVRQTSVKRAKHSEQFEQAMKGLVTLQQCENKEKLEEAIDSAKRAMDEYREGHIIVGKVVLDGQGDVRDVIAQMEILPDGCFASATKDLVRPIGLRMHRYAPYDLQLKGMLGELVDVGTIHMTPLREEQTANLKGKVVLEGNGDISQAVLYLRVVNCVINTPDNSTSGRNYWPEPIKIQATKTGIIEASGFSPINYYCTIEMPGSPEKALGTNFKSGQTFDFGTVTLEKPKQIWLSYIVSRKPRFDLNHLKNVAIAGGTRWKAADNKSSFWDLEFRQEKGFILMKASYGPCFLQDLGKGEIADYVNVDKTKIGQNQPWNQKAKNEHVYLLNQEHWKRWVLFKIVIE